MSIVHSKTNIYIFTLQGAKEIPDFGDDEYPNMISVQSGQVSQPVTLMPGTAYEASQILQVM